jgi:hypothetical protein
MFSGRYNYRYCVAKMEHCLFGDAAFIEGMGHDGWPALVGVGSVCRRRLLGENGLMRVLDTLGAAYSRAFPFIWRQIRSSSKLKDRPRVASVDSMAWNSAARWEAFQTQQRKGKAFLTERMERWVVSQGRTESRQLPLL